MAKKIVHSSGKRKTSIARATVKEGKGNMHINTKRLDTYSSSMLRDRIREPLVLAGDSVINKVDIKVNVSGGGVSSQADAVRLAIGKALNEWSGNKLQSTFLDYDRTLLVADVRRKETYKPNDSKARAKRQSSKR